MQNFTFGRKGLNWFLFAFILFVGNLSASYAQNCPTLDPGDENQSFCYLDRVSDLDANPNGDGVRWYRTATSDTPIPSDEILQDGSYFAGNDSGDCTAREEVVVTVDDLGPPTSTFGNFYEPCEYSSSDVTTVGELKALINTTGTANDINVYDQSQEFGTVELNDGDILVEGRSYFVGQDDTSTPCQFSSRIAIRYDPILATAPAAAPAQTYCESATVADLEAQGINRWYSTDTSNPALDPSTPLVDGQTYFASRIVNRTNSSLPPCESQDRTPVTVTLTDAPDAGPDNFGIVCETEVGAMFPSLDAVRNFYLDLLESGVPRDGTFEPTISEIVDQYNADSDGLGDFTVTYTIGEDECEDSVELTIRVIEEQPANAGSFDPVTDVCADDDNIDLTTLTNNDPDATMGGTFSGTGVTDNEFDPSVGKGTYTITYSVDETSAPCTTGSDETTFTITVDEADAGENGSITLSPSDDPVNLFDSLNGTPDMGGTWNPGDGTFDPATDTPGDFTYTVSNDCGEDSAIVTVIVNDCPTPPDAGEDNTGFVCLPDVGETFPSNDEVRKFYLNLLETGVSRTGSFEPSISRIIEIYNEDEDGLGDFSVNYTIGEEGCQDTVKLTISVVEEKPANAGSFDPITDVCTDDDNIDLTTLANNDPDATTGGTFSGSGVTDNEFDPSIGEGEYTITYRVDDTTPCTTGSDETTFTITVDDAPVNTNINRSLCVTEARDLISDTGAGLAYLQSLVEEAGVESFDPDNFSDGAFAEASRLANFIDTPTSDSETFNFEYTDPSDSVCDDGTIAVAITINNVRDAEAGDIEDQNICASGEMIDLTDFFTDETVPGGTFTGPGVSDNMFDSSLGSNEDGYEITYTVDDSADCVTPGTSDSTSFTIFINSSVDAGDNGRGIVCLPDVPSTFSSNDEVRKFYLNLLDSGVSRDGTFNPTIAQIIEDYNDDEDGLGDFTVIYTIGEDGCEDSVELTITVVEEKPANAGSFEPIEDVCSDEDPIDLSDLMNNDPDATIGGTFSGDGVEDNEFDPSIGEGTYTITYSVDETTPCTTGSDDTTFTITVEDSPVSTDVNRTLCITDARDLISDPASGLAYLQGLVEEAGVESFDPDNFSEGAMAEAARLASFIETPTSDSEIFNFEYTEPSTSICDDGVISIEITINDLRDAEAGEIEDQTVCDSSGLIDLTDFFGDDSVPGGTFSGTGVSDNMFDSSLGSNEDGYEITYTIDDSTDCVTPGTSDSTTFTIFIDGSVDAGQDNSESVCVDDISSLFPNNSAVRNFYLNLLEDGVSRDGTFDPTIQELIDDFNNNPDKEEFATIYTLTNGSCSDSARLAINVFDAIPAEIGDIETPDPICQNADDVDLFSFLPEGANTNGTFEGYEDGIFSPGMEGAGSFEITYRLTEDSPCTEGEASATFTITVTESAFAGQNVTVPEACMSDVEIDLNAAISADADTGGEFTFQDSGDVITGGILDPASLAADTYIIVYTVAAINDCGNDTAELSLTVSEAPDAPTVDGDPFTFCATDGATGADLSANGSNLTFYSDEALSTMVMADDALATGTYYVTQRLEEGGCESEAAEFSVTVNDAATPTISNTTQEFCEFDDATIADLTAEINETGTITWYDSATGDNALTSGTPLQDGITYYATLFNTDTGCESSVRLAVDVVITDCPLLFPEGFSPNGDGLNDTFDIENIEDEYPNYTIEIFNRWGDSVYKGNRNTPDWDGFSQDSSLGDDILPVGAYFYYLNFNDGSTEPRRGTVYLSR